MGLFDDIFDEIIDLPGKVLEAGCEAVTRLPEMGIKAVEGVVKGVEKGVEKTMDAIDGE